MASAGIIAGRAVAARRRIAEIQAKAVEAGLNLPASRPPIKNAEVQAVQELEDVAAQLEFLVDELTPKKSQPKVKESKPVTESQPSGKVVETEQGKSTRTNR